ncbi:hypothetical protein TSAR_011058 [Trichomalopsis sarcophagae]|uniref:Uncharacterized protein n=1 Tax=Trichomalopsis sarcophagae TaxID=543379 RepID=A0A232FGJ5_9HYME|nr:hypothetical protein TSAR_011058 [Trichomalopsis sarcophagae]
MLINNSEDSLDHNVSKPSLPKKLIIEKYKRLAEKAQKKQDCVDVSNEIESIEDCVKEQNEKSDDSRDIAIEKSALKEIKRIKVSVPVRLSESERRIQLTKKTIMQEKLFKRSCSEGEKFKMSAVKEPEVKKSFKNYPRQQNNRSRMQNSSKWNQKGNKSNSFVKPIRSSENSFKLEGSKVLENYSTQQDDRSDTNDKKSNKLVVPSSTLDNSLNPSSSTSPTASNVALSPSKLTSSESINNIECKSVLHLKKPLVNKQNEAIYNKNHGKMEPMSWLVINSREDHNSKKNAFKFQKGRLTKESIEKVAARKDEGNKEFLNFVDSSTNSNTVFRVHSNVTEIRKIASPLSKIKTSIGKQIDANLRVTAQIKEKFLLSRVKSTANRVIDLIECKMEQSLLMSELINEKTLDNKENSSALISSQLQEKTVEISKDLHFKKEPKDISSAPLKENLVNTAKKQTDIEDDDDDDRFNFEKPTRNVTPSVKEDGSSKMSNSAKKLSVETQAYLTKLKQFHKTQLDYSLDSDDLSLVCTSEIDDLSALRGSTYSKFEAVTNKIINSSTEDSYKFSQSAVAEQNKSEKLQLKACQNFEDNKKRIKIEEKNLDTIPNEIKNQLIEKGDSKPNLEFDLDSGLGLKTSNSTNSFIISRDESESDSGACCTIFHKHSDVPSNVIIQEIDSTFEAKCVKSEMQSENLYEDIDSEEFDIVNVEEFGPCAALLDKLKAVAAAQKAMATDIINDEDAKAIMGFEENYEIAADEIEKGGVKAIMGLEENNNEINTQSTSMKTGEDEPAITKDNISEKVETDKSRDSGYPLSDCDNTPKICNPTTTKAGVSKRVQKMKNALQKYQKKYKTDDTGEGSPAEKVQQEQQQQEQQRPIDAQKNQSLRTGLILPRRQILNEILKQKLHLQCKPILIQDLKQR